MISQQRWQRWKESGLSKIKVSDIKARIDLGVCAVPDTYEIPVEIELPEGYELVSDVKLVVTAAEQPIDTNNKEAGK